MPKSSLSVSLKGADDIFSTEESRQEQQREQVQQIPIGELFPFKNHPCKVLDDESMQRTVESVEQYGVLSPLIARPRPEGGYEIISGHRRQHAAQLAGLENLPVIVRQMDDDAAVILMVDSNLQRENILPSERAFAYKMKLEALKNQGARSDLTSAQVGRKLETADIVGQETGDSRNQVRRFIRLTNLVPELLDMVDEKKIAFNPAVELSYLDESQQPLARGSQPLGMSTGDTAFLRAHKSRAGFGTWRDSNSTAPPQAGQQKPRCNNGDRCLRQKQREAAPGQRAKRNSAASGQMPVRCAVPSFTYGVCR